jgi:hypothetical protein
MNEHIDKRKNEECDKRKTQNTKQENGFGMTSKL